MKLELIKLREEITQAFELCQGNEAIKAMNKLDSVLDNIEALIKKTECDIEEIVCEEFRITKYQLHSKLRNRQFVLARQIITWYEMEHLQMKDVQACIRFNQNRSSVHNSKKAIDNLIETDKKFKERLDSLILKFKAD